MAAASGGPAVMRRAFPLALLVAVVAAGPAQGATSVKRYSAWTDDGEPTIARWFHGSGECTQASLVNPREDAWRCTSGNIALDPCFQSPTDDEVLCLAAPWARQGHLLSAALEPEDHGSSPARGPWALRVGRRRCTYIPGPAKRGRRPTYRCGKRSFLFGRPKRRKPTWTIKLARNKRGRGARRAKIRAAWT